VSHRRGVFALAVLLGAPALLLAEARLLRHPSYHQGKVAFSYLGDIWVAREDGSRVERLTVHKARDVYPRFSPDGRWIAFSSNRAGNYDVYVIPGQGGEPKQLTFHSGNDIVVGWTPDSQRVIFQASRGRLFPGIPSLYEVSIDGGLEQPIPTDWGAWGSYSADGKKLAFNRHSMVWWRKHYRGSYAADLWVMDASTRKFTHLGDDEYKGNYLWPMYGAGGEIYFVADRLPNEKNVKPGSPEVMKSVNNIWKIGERGGRAVQVTHHTDGNLFFPSISSDGKVIVYEENFGLWKLDTATGKTAEIKLHIVSDAKENLVETLAIQNEADSYALSPSTKRAAISTHGEIFTIATDRGESQRVTESYSRETNPQWSPDGKWIAFFSDRSGQEEIWIADERGGSLKKLTDADTEKTALEWAPDSKSLLYAASDHKLYRVVIETGKSEVVAASDVANISNSRFSPDGAWISFTRMDRNLRPHIYVVPAAGGPEHLIDREDLFSATGARWTPDGKKLIFLAGMLQSGTATQRSAVLQLHSVSLVSEEKNPADRGVDSEDEAQTAEPARRGRPGPPAAEPAAPPRKVEVKIEWDGLGRRIRQLTRLGDSVNTAVASPDSKLYAFTAAGEQDNRRISALYTIQEDGEKMTRVATSQPAGEEGPPAAGGRFGGGISSPQFSKDGRTIYYLEGNGIYSVEVGGGGSSAPSAPSASRGAERKRVSFQARVEVDHRAEWKQVVDESWRVMKHEFYDPAMHGVDWNKVKATFEPLVDSVADQEEMHDIVSRMLGEMNASHTGISAGGPESRTETRTRYPGFELEADPSGYYKVSYVYRDGPADHDYVNLRVGNFVLAVNGQELKAGENYWKLYNSAPGRKMEFTLNSKPAKEGAWKTKLEPASATAFITLQYKKWVAERQALVEKLSGGEIGYLHIRAMDAESLRKFERDLVDNHFKKALVIDQRFNPGGGIDQELLQILQQRQYQLTRPRDSVEVARPQRAFYGPMVVMQNERSTSDAEMFPDGFRALGLGKVVGVTTYGAVIGTGAHRLMDGSSIRTPASGVWSVKGYNLENYGVPPDVRVDNTPEDFLAGRDAQLEKAVEILKGELKQRGGK
jgi:tricorn protease